MGWLHEFSSPFAKWNGRAYAMPSSARRKAIDKMLTWEDKDSQSNVLASHKVLKSAMVGSTYYGAVTTEKPGKSIEVWAAIILTHGGTKHDNTIWGHKDMDETMGPYYYDCPKSILSLLTPTNNERANEWREECRKNHEEKAKRRKADKEAIFCPAGVVANKVRGGWIFNSHEYQTACGYRYSGVKMSKWQAGHSYSRALRWFLEHYGTKEQKAAFAAKGLECPAEWKGAAA